MNTLVGISNFTLVAELGKFEQAFKKGILYRKELEGSTVNTYLTARGKALLLSALLANRIVHTFSPEKPYLPDHIIELLKR